MKKLSPVIILLNPLNKPPPVVVCISIPFSMYIMVPASARKGTKAYKELEIQSVLETQQGTGTFIGPVSGEQLEAVVESLR